MSNYKEGQIHQLANSLETAGFSADHLTKLGQLGGDGLQKIIAFLDGKAEIVFRIEEVVVALLSVVGTFAFPATKGKKTKHCFVCKIFGYRDSDLDCWLPEDQQDQEAGKFSVQKNSQPATFKRVVEDFLGVSGDIDFLAKTLIERRHTTTLTVVESFIKRQESGEDVGLLTDGWANFFFVEEKDEEGKVRGVSVVYARRNGGRWRVNIHGLDDDCGWSGGRRFFFRNMDTVSL